MLNFKFNVFFDKITNLYLVKCTFTKIADFYVARPAVFVYAFFYMSGVVVYFYTYDMSIWDFFFKKNYVFIEDSLVYGYRATVCFVKNTYFYMEDTYIYLKTAFCNYISYPEPLKIKPFEVKPTKLEGYASTNAIILNFVIIGIVVGCIAIKHWCN